MAITTGLCGPRLVRVMLRSSGGGAGAGAGVEEGGGLASACCSDAGAGREAAAAAVLAVQARCTIKVSGSPVPCRHGQQDAKPEGGRQVGKKDVCAKRGSVHAAVLPPRLQRQDQQHHLL